MKKKFWIIIALIAAAIAAGLCIFFYINGKNSIVGTWTRVEQVSSSDDRSETGFVFKRNGDYESYRRIITGGTTVESRTYGTWNITDDNTLVVQITDTKVNGKTDYIEDGDTSKTLLGRDKAYTKERKMDTSAKKRDSVQCYYLENDTLYIDGIAFGKEAATEKAETESKTEKVTEDSGIQFNLVNISLLTDGTYEIQDIMGRNLFSLCETGTYLMYENKLILCADYNRMEMQFYRDGDNWIYDAEDSYGISGMEKIGDLAVWNPVIETE